MRYPEFVYVTAIAAGCALIAGGIGVAPPPVGTTSSPSGLDLGGLGAGSPGGTRSSGTGFVNWETPQIHALEMTPDGTRLLVANTADARLDVYGLASGLPVYAGSVPVGLDPTSVRARTNAEAWVVNHISDTVSIVNLSTMNVTATLKTGDEPADVAFAGSPQRAFVSCSQANALQVFDPANLATAPVSIPVNANAPRAMGVSPDGNTVYCAIFESGNHSTAIGGSGAGTRIGFPPNGVGNNTGPYGGTNPPPNSGTIFSPAIAPANNPPIGVSLIVKKNSSGRWMDDNNHDWTGLVNGPLVTLPNGNIGNATGRQPDWDLWDHDVVLIDASSLNVSYADGLMNICMSMAVNPVSGRVCVVGTDATNEVRFEPNVKGKFVRVKAAFVSPTDTGHPAILDLNPHLDYTVSTIPQAERDKSLGDPRGIVWNSAGTRAYISGMGSNCLVVTDYTGARAGLHDTIPVGEGPTGLAIDESRGQLYVLNKFAGSLSVVSLATEIETRRIPFFDPTPSAIKTGRKHLYDTHKNSGLGQLACASCHVDGKMDRLAWDLGDPQGAPDTDGAPGPTSPTNFGFGFPGLEPNTTAPAFAPYHAMKGPMTTQTFQGIIGMEPFHWRGDRRGLENFGPAFMGLQGDDTTLTPQEMNEFKAMVATITYPPNPFRNFDNTLPSSLNVGALGHHRTGRFGNAGQPLPNGNAVNGLALYRSRSRPLDGGALSCVNCHTLPTGAGTDMHLVGASYQPVPVGPNGEHHLGVVSVDGTSNITTKIPHFRNAYKKAGFDLTQSRNTSGFGMLHDGSVDSIERFVAEPVFNVQSDQEVADLTAFILSVTGSELPQGSPSNPFEPPGPLSRDVPAAVGVQVTLSAPATQAQTTLINSMLSLANANKVGVVVKGIQAGRQRGYAYTGAGVFQSDRRAETATTAALLAAPAPGSELTFTVVPINTQIRIGIDRDADTWYDGDELAVCANPADPTSFPGSAGNLDVNADLTINVQDFLSFLQIYSSGDPRADFNRDGAINVQDFLSFLAAYAAGCS
jgi:YVTN family beta-propeller protein